jgi:SAM-dependent methyltransferase
VWNSNIHYHPVILAAVPPDARRILDVGCGDGLLSAELARRRGPVVVGLDVDASVVTRARTRHPGSGIAWLCADVLAAPFKQGSFDAVVSVAIVHHVDAERALRCFAQLVRPGGSVAIVGLAANDWWDWPYAMLGAAARRGLAAMRGHWEHSAPQCWPPPLTYRQMRRVAVRILPGARFRHHLLGRYSIVWDRPL